MSETEFDVGCPECGAVAGFPGSKESAKRAAKNLNSGESDCGACGYGGDFEVVVV